jgi:outer membrane protein OmpA-like peptidoglycan-associated protein
MKQNNKTIYFTVDNADDSDDRGFDIFIIEVEEMKQDIVVNMSESIDRDGKVALYGILFDVGKSNIKPESAEALKTITDYLTSNPSVKVIVVGHTDNTGNYESNITLSKSRAESVKSWLVTNGRIDAARLRTEGAGMFCPVASNDSEDGRKQNRRVEIVKQ